MAQNELTQVTTKDELDYIIEHIKNDNHFLLSGGAGSGKTYTLVQTIRKVIEEYPLSTIACITYTNAAVREIEERVNHSNLRVSTIHDFLWDNIKHFQKELKDTLVELVNDEAYPRFIIPEQTSISVDFYDTFDEGIQYKEFVRLKDGIISHDELITLAFHMFRKFKKLCDILIDKHPFIFVDEYQDTQKEVVELLLVHTKQSNKKNIIGFFGDSMQSIYDDGIGNLDEYKGNEDGQVKEVKKEQNRRNPQFVIDLANKLRTDGLTQRPSEDAVAPNMANGGIKEGNIKFLYSSDSNLNNVRAYLGWDFTNLKETKELNLTHNLIADKAGFKTLVDIYDKDQVLAYRDRIKKFIKDQNVQDDLTDKTFGEVIELLKSGKTGSELKKVLPTDGMKRFIEAYPKLFEGAKKHNYTNFLKVYVNKDQLLDDKKQNIDDENKKGSKRDDLIKHLFRIQNNISLYLNRDFNGFIKATDFQICNTTDKKKLRENIQSLVDAGDKTIGEIIAFADEIGLCKIDDGVIRFKDKLEYVYNRVCSVKYEEFQNLYSYLEGYTPFSTQHKTKGAEFSNVLVVLDNGNWNQYNFEYLFTESGTESVLKRTQKIFYVCCTRAKDYLAVFFHNPKSEVIAKASEWFGEGNVINLDTI